MDTGLKNAIKTAEWALAHSAAYRKFVKKISFKKTQRLSPKDFFSLPVSDKKNYIAAFDFWDLMPDGFSLPMASASSGSSGSPTFWLRGHEQEKNGGKIHQFIFENIFGVKPKEKTLVIVCFSMGIWVAGGFTLSSCRHLSKNGFNLTTITPGIEKQDIFKILDTLAPKYDTTILAGYPPFIIDVLHAYGHKKIQRLKNVKILTSGEKISEEWREKALNFLGSKRLADCISLYGCADAGVLGFETPLTISVRRAAAKNSTFKTQLFGETKNELPLLVQYLPEYIYFEQLNNELVFTVKSGVPLIRYNLRDIGEVVSKQKMLEILNQSSFSAQTFKNQWNYPFVIKRGRSDVGLTYYALNIYPENLKWSVENAPVHKMLSGSFSAFSKNSKTSHKESFYINLELSEKARSAPKAISKIAEQIAVNLSKINLEFRKLYSTLGEKALPKIHFLKFGDKQLNRLNSGFIWQKDKKPRMVI